MHSDSPLALFFLLVGEVVYVRMAGFIYVCEERAGEAVFFFGFVLFVVDSGSMCWPA